jgi:hypothetical protein
VENTVPDYFNKKEKPQLIKYDDILVSFLAIFALETVGIG